MAMEHRKWDGRVFHRFSGAFFASGFWHGVVRFLNGWLTNAQFLDGLALSGVLPAPLIIFSTFVGFVAGGSVGAIVMTDGSDGRGRASGHDLWIATEETTRPMSLKGLLGHATMVVEFPTAKLSCTDRLIRI